MTIKFILAFLFILTSTISSKASPIDVIFSPLGGGRDRIIKELNQAKKNIFVAVYKLSNKELAEALLTAEKRGVEVKIILDKSEAEKKKSMFSYLKENKLAIKKYIPPTGGNMHHKFCIIDQRMIITGSYNWNNAAEEENNETLLFITGDSNLVEKFLKEFDRLWNTK